MIVTMEQHQRQINEALTGRRLASQIYEHADELDGWHVVGGNEPATYTGGPRTYQDHMTMIRDREDGRLRPFFENEWDLRRMRAMTRRFATYTSVAVGAMESLNVYVMGGDWEYKIEPKKNQSPNPKLVEEIQRVLDSNLERNDWLGLMDSEIHNRSREDGCSPIALYGARNGLTDFRRIEPECITEPANTEKLDRWLDSEGSSWTFGVHTVYDQRMKKVDHTRHAGYHCVYDDGGKNWDYIPAWPQLNLTDGEAKCMHLINRNVTQSSKMGVSDYFPVMTDLEREDKLNRNLSVGAAIQAAIAYIEKMGPQTTKEDASAELGDALDKYSKAVAKNQGTTRSKRNLPAGHVIKTDHEYQASPMGSMRQPVFVEVDQFIMKRIGRRWIFPDYMITGDTGSANFASTLVSEHPFVKAREKDQRAYVREFKQIHMKALYIAYLHGCFDKWVSDWSQITQTVDLVITPQEVASRDKAAILSEVTARYDRKAMDANEMRTTLDREEKEEYAGVTKKDPPPMAPGGPGGPGGLGGPGGPGGPGVPRPDSQGGTQTDGDAQAIQRARPEQKSTGSDGPPVGVHNVRTKEEARRYLESLTPRYGSVVAQSRVEKQLYEQWDQLAGKDIALTVVD